MNAAHVRSVILPIIVAGLMAAMLGFALLSPSLNSARVSLVSASEPVKPKPVIAVILSYHNDYPWQGEIVEGIEDEAGDQVELVYHEMKTLGVSSAERLEAIAERARAWLREVDPDVVIVADDHAMRMIVEESGDDLGIPAVFCGVNWPAASYRLPRQGVTGMVEVSPSARLLEVMDEALPADSLVVILGKDRATDRAQAEGFQRDAEARGLRAKVALVRNFQQWQEAFIAHQGQADLIYVLNNAGIAGWDDSQALKTIQTHGRVLTASEYAWMKPFVAIAALKDGREQGAWAMAEALLLTGSNDSRPGPIVVNQQVTFSLNEELLANTEQSVPTYLRIMASESP